MSIAQPVHDNGSSKRVKVLEKTIGHIQDKILAIKAQDAHDRGYIGVEATKALFAKSGVSLD